MIKNDRILYEEKLNEANELLNTKKDKLQHAEQLDEKLEGKFYKANMEFLAQKGEIDGIKYLYEVEIVTKHEHDDNSHDYKYSQAYKMSDKWLFLTGHQSELSEIWEKYYISTWITTNNNQNTFDINHAAPIYIIDQNQNIKLLHTEPIVAKEIVHDIKLLINK